MDLNKWDKDKREFLKRYPLCPDAEDIEVLNLLMLRKNANEILKGNKSVELRIYSELHCNRLYDKNVLNFLNRHEGNKEVQQALEQGFIEPLRMVNKIHFHNYTNSWFLDVECKANDTMALIPSDVKFLQDSFGFHELDKPLRDMEARKEKKRPVYFWFALGDVIDTSLKLG